MMAPAAAPTEDKRLHIAIVGCGRIVQAAYAGALRRLGEQVEGVALASPDRAQRERVAEILESTSLAQFDSAQALCERGEVDVAIVAAPHDQHLPIIRALAAANIDVISEKPLTTTLKDADEIGQTIRESGIRFAFVHNYLFDPTRAQTIAAIQDGRIGRVFLCRLERLVGTPFYGARGDHGTGAGRRTRVAVVS